MDPRHPEQAILRMRELMKQYYRIESDINNATTSAQLGQLEREGGLVIQEICLVAPRIHEAMMQASRQRRHNLSRGVAFDYTPEEKVAEESLETYVAPNQAETVIVEPKPRKKKTIKKKKSEK